MTDANQPFNESRFPLAEVRETVEKLESGKATGVCNITANIPETGSETMIQSLDEELTAV